MADPLRVLMVFYHLAEAEQMVDAMRESGFEPDRRIANTEEAFGIKLDPDLDLILVDDNQRDLAAAVLETHKQREFDVPFIMVVDAEREAEAGEWIAQGADDYLVGGRLRGLRPTVVRAQEKRRLIRERKRAEEELGLRNQELTSLAAVARILAQPISLPGRATEFLEEILRMSHGDSATLRAADADQHMHLIARAGGTMEERPDVQPPAQGLSAAAFQQGKTVVANDYPSHPAAEASAIDQGSKSMISLPLSTNGEILGTVTVVSKETDHFKPELVRQLTTLVGGAGMLLENVRLTDHLRSSAEEIILVDQVATTLTSTLDISQVFAKFADKVRTLVDFDLATINVIDRDAHKSVAQHFVWAGSLKTEPPKTFDLKGTQTEQAMLTGQTIIQDDLGELPGFSTDGFFNDRGLRSTILTPLVYSNLTIGSMSLASSRPRAYGLREQRILERLARQVAPAVENARLYEEAVSRTVQLECLLSLAEILGQTRPFEEKVSRVLEQLVQVAEGYSAHFRVPDATGQELVLAASAGAPDGPGYPRPESMGEGSLVFKAYQQGRTLVVNDYQNDPKALPYLDKRGDRSAVFLPIGGGPKPAAVVSVDSNELDHFTPDRVRLLTAIGEGLGTLLENGRLSEELRSSTQEMAMVDEVARTITTTLDIDDEYEKFATETRRLVKFDRMTVNVIDRDGLSLSVKYEFGEQLPGYGTGTTHPLEGTKTAHVMATGESLIREGMSRDSRFVTDPLTSKAGLRSNIAVPLTYKGKVIGSMILSDKEAAAYGSKEQAILERLAGQIAPALENARLYQEAQERAREIQRLNGLTNRILASNPSALAVLRGSCREVVTVNRAFLRAFGLNRNEIEGKPISQGVNWVGLQEIIRESLSSPSGEGQNEMRYLAEDGTERWFLVSAVPLMAEDDSEHEDEALLVLSDITEQKRQKDRLQEHSRLASVGQLAAGVAHEINNPLAAIHGISELLQMEDLPVQVSEDVRKIQEAAQRAAKVVQNLLSFARTHEPEKQYLDVASIVDRATALKAHEFTLNNIQVTTHHSNRVPPTMVDEHQLIQVVLNILTNAEQSIIACQRAGNITTTTRLVKGMIRISICDDGLGIPAENLHSVLDPFFSTKEIGEGTGLGLSICYGIVREHGGELWVESVPGEGAKFHIELPVLPEEFPTEAQETNTSSNPVSKRRILVVDDEPLVRDILYRGLSADGHDVTLACSGEEAWELIKEEEIDIIITDLRMPGIGGQGLYQLAKEFSPDLAKKIVFITGDTASAKAGSFLKSTGNRVLHKPFGMDAIRQLLQPSTAEGNAGPNSS